MELNTGTSLANHENQPWFLATRGQKLRDIAAMRRSHLLANALVWGRKAVLVEALKAAGRIRGLSDESYAAGKKLVEALADFAIYVSVVEILDNLEKMVLGEIQEGWNWRAGLRAQLDERFVLFGLVTNLSVDAQKAVNQAARAINTH
jgi:hypothetical protein